MVIDTILQAGVTFGVSTRLALENDGPAVRKDQPVPDKQHAALPELHIVVILADDARALWHQQDTAGRAVVNVLGNLRGNLARPVGPDDRDQCCGYNGSRLKDEIG